MNKLIMIVLISLLFLGGCGTVAPGERTETVLIMKPLIFGHGGIDPTPVKTGREFVALTTDGVDVDMAPQQIKVHIEDAMTKEGVPVDFETNVNVTATDSVKLVSKYGPDVKKLFNENIYKEYENFIRQEVRQHGMNETAISTTAIAEIDSAVTKNLDAFIKEQGYPVVVRVTVGAANPPDAIKTQRVETAAQEQRMETEKKKLLAEVQRKLAEEARAASDNAYREAMNMSPAQYIQLEQIKMLGKACAGQNCTFIVGGGSGVTPVLDVKK